MPEREVPTPFHFHFTAHKGDCGKPRVVPHNRQPKPEPTEMEVMKWRVLLTTYGSRVDATKVCEGSGQ